MDWNRYKQKAVDWGLDVGISAANQAKRVKGISEEDRQEWENVEKNLRRKRELRERGVSSYDDDEWDSNEYNDNIEDDWESYDDVDDDEEEDDNEWDDIENRFDLPGREKNKKQKETVEVTNATRRFMREKTHCNLGILGHIGHGKTTLTTAITKVLSERCSLGKAVKAVEFEKIAHIPEERNGNIILSAAAIEYETPNRHYTHIDFPKHTDYVKGLITGSFQMDGAILVVDASEGVMVQTHEQISLAHQINIPYIVVFINKCEIVDDSELLELIDLEIRALLNEYGFPGDDIPIVQGSALKALEDPFSHWGDRILELMEEVDCYISDPISDRDKPFLMPVEDIFGISGRGTVATGRVERGTLHLGDEVEVVGISEETRKVVVTGIEMFRKLLNEALAGDNVGLLLRGVQTSEIERGQCLCKPGTVKCCDRLVAQIYVLDENECGRRMVIFNQHRCQFYFRTGKTDGICYLPKGREMCISGDNVEMLIELTCLMPIEQGLLFALRENGKTVGFGRVVSIYTR